MQATLGTLALAGAFLVCASAGADESPRQRLLMDFQWKFHRGDVQGADQAAFDDARWRGVDLPHDWSIECLPGSASPFDPQCPAGAGGGYLPGGVGWYRKTFPLPEGRGRRAFIEFEGVYMDSDVWLNGQHLGNHPYGYTSFEYELTPYLKPEGPNVLAVRAKVLQPCSRWYSGAGIYRHVWLTVTDPIHVAHWGAYVTTPEVSKEAATVRVRTRVVNQSDGEAEILLRTRLLDADGKEAARKETAGRVAAGAETEFDQSLPLAQPHRWSPADPHLYTAVSDVHVGGKVVDTYRTSFGVRTIEFTRDRGFLLNGEPAPIRGVCNHHDQGCLGAAAYDRAIERQLEILKAMGCNAIRTSHNPPAPTLLDLCDRLGFVVMDEAFDEWKQNKTKNGYGRFFDEWSDRDVRSMLRRDRNHPCVVLWSIGNEIPEQGDRVQGPKLAKYLADICRAEDPTRPVTSACNNPSGAVRTGYAESLEVLGINYHAGAYDAYKGKYALTGSETSSTVSTRGEYNLVLKDDKVVIEPRLNTQCTAYDLYRPPWAVEVEAQLKKIQDSPWVAGEFVWTGFDYLGEPTPFRWPAASSYFGIVDLCGFPKDRFYLYQSRWQDRPMVHLLPHWTWPGFEGKAVPVWCYSNADAVELFLNGKSLGEKRMSDARPRKYVVNPAKGEKAGPVEIETGWFHQEWDVPYQPGELKAVAKRDGKVVATDIVATAGKPAQLVLEVDRRRIQGDGQDLAYVTVKVLDAEGRLCPEADDLVQFEASGPGGVIGVGNGNPVDHDDFQGSRRRAFHGLCLAVLRAGKAPGALRLTAHAGDLKPAEAEITVQAAGKRPAVP